MVIHLKFIVLNLFVNEGNDLVGSMEHNTLFVGFLVILASTGCILTDFIQDIFKQPDTEIAIPDVSSQTQQSNQTIEEPVTTIGDVEKQWARITDAQVEIACLEGTRGLAEKKGLSRNFVFSCKCNAQEAAAVKTYDCTVTTANPFDPNVPLTIECIKDKKECSISSSYGGDIYTFDELESFKNK